jgi:hypothetical protein
MNKPKKSWGEIQLAIAAVAITVTLGFWNLFSAGQKQEVAVVASATDTEAPPTEEVAQAPAPTPTQRFLPVKIIFGGTPPQQKVVIQVNAPKSQPKHKGNGGGGGGAPQVSQPPQPPVTTGSSKP